MSATDLTHGQSAQGQCSAPSPAFRPACPALPRPALPCPALTLAGRLAVARRDYAYGILCTAIVFWLTLGEARLDSGGDGHAVDRWRVLASIGAGTIFNIANVLMVYGINLAGLSVAFPLAIGTSLVLGTVLTYFVDTSQRPSSPERLFLGVALGFIAVVFIAVADNLRAKSIARSDLEMPINSSPNSSVEAAAGAPPRTTSPAVSGAVCLVSGVLMSCWAPLSAYAQDTSSKSSLSPFFAFLLFSGATLLTSLKPSPIAVFLFWCEDQEVGDYSKLSPVEHLLGWGGGVVWAFGTCSNLVAGSTAGLALTYALGQAAPLAAMGWGVLYCERALSI